ncbi:MAG: NAD(P)-dependent oxidoreductase [Clostridia bacterium]|nr:NAD(P)-dependent oxidoreductase [Clostridia bacterium]
MKVLVTGASGMVGSALVKALSDGGVQTFGIDRCKARITSPSYTHIEADLGDADAIRTVIKENGIQRIIHLAALAHTAGEDDLSYERYYHINVECAKNIFSVAAENNIPVLFISTADVYGFTRGTVGAESPLSPVTPYGKTKMLAEEQAKSICEKSGYTIFRLAPVYTPDIQRDIQKRYYLKYPNIAYIIGKGTEYEVLNIDCAVKHMCDWVQNNVENNICNIKDPEMMNTADRIKQERNAGRAKHILHIPQWMVSAGFAIIKTITGKNKYTYLLNKAVNPLRTK